MVVNGRIDQESERHGHPANVPAVASGIVSEIRRADTQLVALVQQRPLVTLCAAAAVGYLLGRVVTRTG
jgi:hypothetical protein